MTKVLVVYHSLQGHVERMAEAVARGAGEVAQANVSLRRVPETMPQETLEKVGAIALKAEVIEPDELGDYDAILFGTPTRFGNMSAQMRTFLDKTGGLWAKGVLTGKIGSVFTSTNTQHGGQESTILSFHTTLLHHGMLIAGVPYACKGLWETAEVSGGSPYGASTIAGSDGKRMPSDNELKIAEFQGRHVAELARRLKE